MSDPSDLIGQLRIPRDEAPRHAGIRPVPLALGVAAVLGLGVLLGAAWRPAGGGNGEARAASAAPVAADVPVAVVAAPAPGTGSPAVLDATGHVVARRVATVSAKVTGRVAEVLVEEGQTVEAGQLLARLDTVDAQAQLALSRSQLAAAEVQVARVDAQLGEAEANLQRQSSLRGERMVSQSALDQAQAHRDALRADRAAAEAAVRVARDQLAIWQLNLEHTEIRAPFDGVLVSTSAQPGEIVSPLSAGGGFTRTGIGTVVDMASLEIEVDVAESNIARIRPGMRVEAYLNAYPDWTLPAEVVAVIPAVDRARATLRVRIALLAKDPRIVPDMGVRVRFLAGEA